MERTVLIKLGGRSLEGEVGFASLGRSVQSLRDVRLVIVHGGGAEISRALRDAHREPLFIDGLRVTTPEDMEIVEQVLSERINGRIGQFLQQAGVTVCRLSGKSDGLLLVEKWIRNGRDLGLVGKIVRVRPNVIHAALDKNQIPLISPISADRQGLSYNVNADSAAAAIAAAVGCSDLIYFTDVPGVQVEGRLVESLTVPQAKELIEKKIIHGGMVAKMESVFEALRAGVPRVHISAWQGDHTLAQILSGRYSFGTALSK
jgi:acetylglutamate kinase